MTEESVGYGVFFAHEATAEHSDHIQILTTPDGFVPSYEHVLRVSEHPRYGNISSPSIFDPVITSRCRYPCTAPGHRHPENDHLYQSWTDDLSLDYDRELIAHARVREEYDPPDG